MINIKVLFFGSLEDISGCKESKFTDFTNLDSLIKSLEISFPKLKGKTYQIAINKKIESKNINLNEGDEIALLPPFAGG